MFLFTILILIVFLYCRSVLYVNQVCGRFEFVISLTQTPEKGLIRTIVFWLLNEDTRFSQTNSLRLSCLKARHSNNFKLKAKKILKDMHMFWEFEVLLLTKVMQDWDIGILERILKY